MCLRPIHIHNQAKTFNPQTVFSLDVPCGECAECKKLFRDQWYLRSYWQARYTFDQNGYVLFDTLTYDDSHLPHLMDFVPEIKDHPILNLPCFSYEDVRSFMNHLRTYLTRSGYNPKNSLRFFLTAEYGHQTHRPHYHVLFYVTDPTLDPIALSDAVAHCWDKGRTDGAPYQGRSYVMARNVMGPAYDSDSLHLRKVCSYVAKYVTKDDDYMKRLKNRLEIVFDSLASAKVPGSRYWDFTETKELYAKVYNRVKMFHRQSQHFGEYALSQPEIDSWLSTGMFAMPDGDTLIRHIPMPMYYARKCFSVQKKRADGSRYWELTELGKQYRYRRTFSTVANVARRYEDWYRNLHNTLITPQDVIKMPSGESFTLSSSECLQMVQDVRTMVKRLLRGRSWAEFANYVVFYKGRVKRSPDAPLESVSDVISQSLSTINGDPKNMYATVEVQTFEGPKKFVQLVDGDPQQQYARKFSTVVPELVSLPVFLSEFVISQDSYGEFSGFDDLIELIDTCNVNYGRRKQQAFDMVDRIQNLRKILKSS